MRIVQYVIITVGGFQFMRLIPEVKATFEFERFGSSILLTINFIGLLRFCLTRRTFFYSKSLGTLTLNTFILKVEQAHEDCVN